MAPGTVVRLSNHIFASVDASKGPHQWIRAQTDRYLSHEQFAARMRGDTTNTSDLTSTQFECFTPQCLRIVMDSLDIEPGTVICVGGWEAMRVVGNGDRGGSDSTVVRTPTRSSLILFVRLMMSCVSSTMGLSDEEHHRTGCHAAFVDANALLKEN